MKSINVWILPLFLIICFSTHVDAQKKKRKLKSDTNNPDRVEIKMKDGEIYIGKLIKLDVDSIIIDHEKLGRLALPRIDVKKSIDLDENDFFKEEGWKKEKYQGQYFISPTARPIGEDTRYYTNFNIFVNTFSFGLTDNFSLTAGFEGVSLIAGRIPIVYINPKFSVPASENVYVGIGTTLFISNVDDETAVTLGGITYANTTIGSATRNFTFGLGVPFSSTGSTSFPLLYQLGFTFPLGKKVNILAESFIDTNFEGLLNIGIRIITKSNIVIDAGLSRPTGIGEIGIIGLPLLSLSIPF